MSHTKWIITDEIFESYINCKYKSHLKLNNQRGKKTNYEALQDRLVSEFHTMAKTKLLAEYPNEQALRIPSLNKITLRKVGTLIIDTFAEHGDLACSFEALLPTPVK